MRAWFIIKDSEVVGDPLGYSCEKAAVIEKMVLESRDDKGIYEIEPREFEIVFKKTENPE